MIKYFVILSGAIMFYVAGCPGPYGTKLPPPTVRPIYTPHSSYHTTSKPSWNSNIDPAYPSGPEGWAPPSQLEIPGRWKGIVVHHSATYSGNATEFNKAHQHRGWDGLGYDFVINNGKGALDGQVEVGYRWRCQETGAHCRPEGCLDNYWNEHTIGICLVGNLENANPTSNQWQSLVQLVRFLKNRYNIPSNRILGHGDVPNAKTRCPGKFLSIARLRRELTQN